MSKELRSTDCRPEQIHWAARDAECMVCRKAAAGDEGVLVTSNTLSALPDLDQATVFALRCPDFRIRMSSAFLPENTMGPVYSEPAPLLTGSRECPDLLVDITASPSPPQRR